MTGFPQLRLRRLRYNETVRQLVRETSLKVSDLVYPLFVTYGRGVKNEVGSMPDVFQYSVDLLPREVEDIAALAIPAVILFGIPEEKDELGTSGYQPDGVVQQAIRTIKKTVPDLLVITDVCLCEYTSHGHCGVVENGEVDNDRTLELLARMAVSHVEAGADVVAPSDMMDGRVKRIRQELDGSGFERVPYLDVIRRVRDAFNHPLAAYNVSGEYSLVKAASAQGWVDEQRIVLEILTAIKRAGADIIITYHAKDVARWLHSGNESHAR